MSFINWGAPLLLALYMFKFKDCSPKRLGNKEAEVGYEEGSLYCQCKPSPRLSCAVLALDHVHVASWTGCPYWLVAYLRSDVIAPNVHAYKVPTLLIIYGSTN